MKEYLKEGDEITAACLAKVNSKGELEFVDFDDREEMYHAGLEVQTDENNRAYVEYD